MSRSQQLALLNQYFYQTVANSFSKTRQHAWEGFANCLNWIGHADSILDLGCGNGRLATFLRQNHKTGDYIGVDSSEDLLQLKPELEHTTWINSSIGEWINQERGHYTCITMFGVLHHLSSEQEILDLLDYAYHNSTTLIMSRWNCIMNNALMSRRIDPASEKGYQIVSRFGIETTDWEPMEFLLDWKRDTEAYRYVRYWTDSELAQLFNKRGFTIKQTWLSDGKSKTENSYFVLQKKDATTRTIVTN